MKNPLKNLFYSMFLAGLCAAFPSFAETPEGRSTELHPLPKLAHSQAYSQAHSEWKSALSLRHSQACGEIQNTLATRSNPSLFEGVLLALSDEEFPPYLPIRAHHCMIELYPNRAFQKSLEYLDEPKKNAGFIQLSLRSLKHFTSAQRVALLSKTKSEAHDIQTITTTIDSLRRDVKIDSKIRAELLSVYSKP